MAEIAISADVERLIAAHFHSVEQLEVLLLLRQDEKRLWTPSDIAFELATTESSAASRLADLAERGFARKQPGGHCYDATTHGAVVDRLADAYARRRVRVIGLIFAKSSDAVQGFADAFKLREDR